MVRRVRSFAGAVFAQAPPSEDQVREALEVLSRYRAAQGVTRGPSEGRSSGYDSNPLAQQALTSPTQASAPALSVVPPASYALSIDGDLALGGFVFKEGAPFIHNYGGAEASNTAVGLYALESVTPGYPQVFNGKHNSAFGHGALQFDTAGDWNTGIGFNALNVTDAFFNTAVGARAMEYSDTGASNTAIGYVALASNAGPGNTAAGAFALLSNEGGGNNTALGLSALRSNSTGSNNVAIGKSAGFNWTTGDNNIAIGTDVLGTAGESDRIRIGDGQAETFIAGISNNLILGGDVVYVTTGGELGLPISSARYKREVEDLRGRSQRLLDLRPVRFRYKEESEGGIGAAEGDPSVQYGLLAEEVADVLPELVLCDEEGQPLSVRYRLLTPLLIGEMQRQHARLQAHDSATARQDEEIASIRKQLEDRDRVIADLRRRLDELEGKKRLSGHK